MRRDLAVCGSVLGSDDVSWPGAGPVTGRGDVVDGGGTVVAKAPLVAAVVLPVVVVRDWDVGGAAPTEVGRLG
jgi:hypothetical protein